jgi:predicted ATPase
MQLHLKNIGPIDAIDINIDSDLTFIYGKNNIGKSYAITILYLALKNIAFNSPINQRYYYSPSSRIRFIDSNLIKDIKIKLENVFEFDITDNIIDYFSNFITTMFLSDFENSLHNSFGDI